MFCQRCNEREATIHTFTIDNGQKQEFHLCVECAKEQFPELDGQTMEGMLNAFLNQQTDQLAVPEEIPACTSCGMKLDEFRSGGKLGCQQCYAAFAPWLANLLPHIQKAEKHVGKTPTRWAKAMGLFHERDRLRREMDAAVKKEAYEHAAAIRDRIRDLDLKIEHSSGQ